jgi:formate dehydrogenase
VLEAQRKGADLIIVDPRCSVSAQSADLHVAVLPNQDWAFLLGLLHVIFTEKLDRPSTAVPLSGVEHIARIVKQACLNKLSERCGVPAEMIRDVARRFAGAERAVCITHTGVAHTITGTLAEWLGCVINAVTNRLDQPGGKYKANGLVDLAALREQFASPLIHRTRLRDLPTIAGCHSLIELPDEIITPGPGQIRAMLIAAGNPVISGPDGDAFDGALASLELLVAIDLVQRESHRHAHCLIPGTHFLEREGVNATMFALAEHPFAQYAPRAIEPPDGVREEWAFFLDLALAMDRNLFGKRGLNRIIRARRWAARAFDRPDWAFTPETMTRAVIAGGKRVRYEDILKHEHGYKGIWAFCQRVENGGQVGPVRAAALSPCAARAVAKSDSHRRCRLSNADDQPAGARIAELVAQRNARPVRASAIQLGRTAPG